MSRTLRLEYAGGLYHVIGSETFAERIACEWLLKRTVKDV